MKYEVWILVKNDVSVKEVLVCDYRSLGATSRYAYNLSIMANDANFVSARVYQNVNGFRHKIASFYSSMR